ncbi:unnamed protein product [Didymodactylos carnosus]|uniref:Uncharacterized protein n=1 Tax=Didymodactylos carnosus TaxID=1234261 RepID=A0A814K8I0_9BILA|nr:unnamed protein product [Didymodactylos carnosus]CAF3817877.1 unnamed protein product [Didymodactylos carnosus]
MTTYEPNYARLLQLSELDSEHIPKIKSKNDGHGELINLVLDNGVSTDVNLEDDGSLMVRSQISKTQSRPLTECEMSNFEDS